MSDNLFDPVLVFSSRLEIVASLVNGQPMSFTELRKATDLADGNLHVQTRKLAEAGYIQAAQTRVGARARTVYRITEYGESQFRRLIATLEQSLERPPAERPRPAPGQGRDGSQVW